MVFTLYPQKSDSNREEEESDSRREIVDTCVCSGK